MQKIISATLLTAFFSLCFFAQGVAKTASNTAQCEQAKGIANKSPAAATCGPKYQTGINQDGTYNVKFSGGFAITQPPNNTLNAQCWTGQIDLDGSTPILKQSSINCNEVVQQKQLYNCGGTLKTKSCTSE